MEIIDRRIFPIMRALSDEKAILVLHGARQTGKSTALHWWLQEERNRGRQTLYFDLEDPAMLSLCESGVEAFIRYIEARGYPRQNLSVALDEIQYLSDPSRFLKLLFDHHSDDLKIAVSGSSSFAIKSKFRESLVGRTIPLELFNLDFGEYCRFVGRHYDFSAEWPEQLDLEVRPVFQHFAETGAYPGLARTKEIATKSRRIRQIIQTYIQTDVRELGKIRYPDRFESLLRFLADQAASLAQVSELASSLRMARETVEEYIFLLEQTYIIRRLRPFSGNARSELTKTPKIYFEDNGILAMCRAYEFLPLDGALFENAVFTELRKSFGIERLHFWRTTEGQEIDFIIDEGRVAVEAKLRPRPADCKNLFKFQKRYSAKRLVICGMEKPVSLPEGVEFRYPWHLADSVGQQ
ncbi:MAG: ATP-binding protein [Rectinema sp.]|jgi:hypothetical protein